MAITYRRNKEFQILQKELDNESLVHGIDFLINFRINEVFDTDEVDIDIIDYSVVTLGQTQTLLITVAIEKFESEY